MDNTPFVFWCYCPGRRWIEVPGQHFHHRKTAKNLCPGTWYDSSLRYIISRPTTIRLTTGKAHVKQLFAYFHPVMQVLVLLMALATLRLGLALKKHRTRQRRLQEHGQIFARHVQLGLLFIGCLCGGYVLGLLSMVLLPPASPFSLGALFLCHSRPVPLSRRWLCRLATQARHEKICRRAGHPRLHGLSRILHLPRGRRDGFYFVALRPSVVAATAPLPISPIKSYNKNT